MKALVLPVLERPEGMTTHDYAFARLRQAIMVGAFRPGTSVTIRGLAEALESSPTPIREALRQLTSIGALDFLENRRIVVPRITPARFEELISLRIVLESHAARRAVAHLSDRQIDRIVAIDEAIEAAILDGQKAAALIANQEFHRQIYMANPDQVAMPLIESVWLQLGPILGIAMEHVTELYVVDRHREAIEALRRRDEDAVAEAIGADIREGIGGFDQQAIGKLLSLAR
ncbi:HTH-type transcriptional regulator McbR [Ensifer psoraleae]|uniref:GntR family transcriptional regulator n=1 Tax=Sinorhizobium psoraleae TaxID=520838 RepID=UPI00156977B2|nr:GntR family transcriptional regulator [Sinorhizobium psoraleae]NRP70072.1 HTH-type transcriptional regulator McbR [Sinorhizobium psoraleae]